MIGASEIAMDLPANLRDRGVLGPEFRSPAMPDVPGRTIALAGSCSVATREQVARARGLWPSARLDPGRFAAEGNPAKELADWTANQPAESRFWYTVQRILKWSRRRRRGTAVGGPEG